MDFLADLNPQQRKAVEASDGPVLVLAGPGSGKTRVLTHRVAYLVQARGIAPRNIIAVTFTNKAAREMRDRLDKLLGVNESKELTLGTFHAICARFLRREAPHLGLSREFAIYDADDQLCARQARAARLEPRRQAIQAVRPPEQNQPGQERTRSRRNFPAANLRRRDHAPRVRTLPAALARKQRAGL